MEKLSSNISVQTFASADSLEDFLKCDKNKWLDQENFSEICRKYGFPTLEITLVIEDYYIDAAYRDIYYHYWSSFHFNWPRYCRRLFLFQNEHPAEHFFASDFNENLKKDFLGVIVVRPPYSSETDHTFGRTLLDPFRMRSLSEDGKMRFGLLHTKTAEYKLHLLGNTYTVKAFPFSSQDGVVMKCAETAIYNLCEFEAAASSQYARVLPSNIQEKLKNRLSERVLPSHGLFCNDISFLLKEFGFSPIIYADEQNADLTESTHYTQDFRIGAVATSCDNLDVEPHATNFKDWFRHYVESSIPVIAITMQSQEYNKHASLVIGRGMRRKQINECKAYKLGTLRCIDATDLYEDYIVQDDNQVPYCEERLDRFTQNKNYKLDAFIVPLDRHVFLDAPSAISIFDAVISQDDEMIRSIIAQIKAEYQAGIPNAMNGALKQQFEHMVNSMTLSEDNPITIRYYLTNSAEYKQFCFNEGVRREDKSFYADVLMPKFVWVAEISTYELYKMGYAFAEIVLDATASKRSGVNSIILFRMANSGVIRRPDEPYRSMGDQIKEKRTDKKLSPVFPIYCNSISSEWDT